MQISIDPTAKSILNVKLVTIHMNCSSPDFDGGHLPVIQPHSICLAFRY